MTFTAAAVLAIRKGFVLSKTAEPAGFCLVDFVSHLLKLNPEGRRFSSLAAAVMFLERFADRQPPETDDRRYIP